MRRLALLSLLGLSAGLAPALSAAAARLDPERAVGPETCARCHDREYAVWQATAHARLYRSDRPLHQRPRAQQIAKSLGIPLIKVDSLCLDCHFTPRLLSGKVLAGAGVSCEHCHGAARDWISVHNTFDGRQVNRRTESVEQRRQRWERNARIGMRFGGNLYDLSSSCYGCHLVPNERLVNVGGHVSGGEFDLAARFDEIRHNFVLGLRRENAPTPPERRRQLYVLGLALELENSLRGLARASQDGGDYANTLVDRVEDAKKRLRKAARQGGLPRLAEALSAVDGLRLAAGNAAELDAAVRKVATAARTFSEQEDGSRLAALDHLLEEAQEPPPETAEADTEAADDTATTEATGATDDTAAVGGTRAGEKPGAARNPTGAAAGSGRPASRGSGGATGGATRPAASQGPAGKIRPHLRDPLPKGTVKGPRNCQASCHRVPNDAWRRDRHFRTAEPFQNGEAAPLRIATLYYGKPANDLLATGQTVCIDCHGTVKGGEIEAGVSCESCHGPAGAFLDRHKTLEGPSNHLARVQAGIVDLENPAVRAEVCSSCHYLTDPRLLASGHPVPKPFDLWARSEKIRHWQGGPDAGALRAAFQQAVGRRGGVPQVQVARLAAAPEPLVSSTAGSGGGAAGSFSSALLPGGAAAARRMGAQNGQPPPPRPYVPRAGAVFSAGSASGSRALGAGAVPRARSIDLPPLPEGIENRPVAEILRLIQQRLAALYAQTGGGS